MTGGGPLTHRFYVSLSGVTSNKEPGRVVYLGSLSGSNPSFARIIFWTMEGGFSGENLAILKQRRGFRALQTEKLRKTQLGGVSFFYNRTFCPLCCVSIVKLDIVIPPSHDGVVFAPPSETKEISMS